MSSGVGKISTRGYKAGSVVYFEGDKSEYIYILKGGKVLLTYLKPETGEEIKEHIKPGEFFGVKSALGRYPREETAQTLTDVTLLVLTLADFETIILGNIAVVKKMLSVFSNQLRRIGKAQREVLGETTIVKPDGELYKIGEYYFKNGKYSQASYAFKKYMSYYPDGDNAQNAMQRIKDIQTGNISSFDSATFGSQSDMASDSFSSADSFGSSDSFGSNDSFGSSSSSSFGFSDSDPDAPLDMIDFDSNTRVSRATEISSEMDDFLGGNSFGAPSAADRLAGAKSMAASGNLAGALSAFKEIADDSSLQGSADSASYEEAHYEIGRVFMQMGKAQDALNSFSVLAKKFPQSKFIKPSLLSGGIIFQQAGNSQKAAAYFQKVASLAPADEVSADAKRRLAQLGV